MQKSVIVLGKGALAIRIAEWFHRSVDHRLICVVPVSPEPTWTESLTDWCEACDVPVVHSGDYRDIPQVRADNWRIDLVFSVFYDKIFPAWFIAKSGCVLNLHNGPLPRFRGMAPINWALKNGEATHGVTIHQVVPEVDAGPIVGQLIYDIHPETDEVRDVYNRALAYGYTLFEQTMPILDRISPRPQDESSALYHSRSDQSRLGERSDFTRAESLASR